MTKSSQDWLLIRKCECVGRYGGFEIGSTAETFRIRNSKFLFSCPKSIILSRFLDVSGIRSAVNFINVKRARFSYERHFVAFFQLHVHSKSCRNIRSYKKFPLPVNTTRSYDQLVCLRHMPTRSKYHTFVTFEFDYWQRCFLAGPRILLMSPKGLGHLIRLGKVRLGYIW